VDILFRHGQFDGESVDIRRVSLFVVDNFRQIAMLLLHVGDA
jgi:hypothetical protein